MAIAALLLRSQPLVVSLTGSTLVYAIATVLSRQVRPADLRVLTGGTPPSKG